MITTLRHALLGEVTGVQHKSEEVVQFFGIQYATLAHRFATPEVKSHYGGNVDATTFGPSVVTSPVGCDIEFGLIQKSLEKRPIPDVSDTDGLNLNITVPSVSPSQRVAGLPVLVFIHGGGFLFGGTWAPHYDLARFVAFAASIGKPVIGVSINYRLGIPGFLDSSELREAGVQPNRGVLDQSVAFQWLRRNIAGFGGDPARVTAIGQSAGGSSVMHLLDLQQDGAPFFDRAVCMSGNLMAAAMFPKEVAQESYKTVLDCLGISSSSSPDMQISLLTAASPGDLLGKVPPSVPLGPVAEEGGMPSFKGLRSGEPPRGSVPLMIGSADFDGGIFEVLGIFAGRDRESLGQDFANVARSAVPENQHDKVNQLLSLYGIPGDGKSQVHVNILKFGTDLKYFASSQAYALSWPKESWSYYFQDPNPWEGPHQGRAAHCLDIAYLFLNYRDVMGEEQQRVAFEFARDVICFVHGEAPWTESRAGRTMRVYGQISDNELPEKQVGPSCEIKALWDEIGLDVLVRSWDAYLARQ